MSSHKLELELDNEEVMDLECAENKETFSTVVFKEESHTHCDIQVIDGNHVKDTFDIISNVSSSVGYDKLAVEDQPNLDGYFDNEEEIFITTHVEFLHNQLICDQLIFYKYSDDEDKIFTLTSIDLRSNDPIFDNYESNFSEKHDDKENLLDQPPAFLFQTETDQRFPEICKLAFAILELGYAVDIKQITKNSEISKGISQQFSDFLTNEIGSDHVEDNM